jgi:hypothetical protein
MTPDGHLLDSDLFKLQANTGPTFYKNTKKHILDGMQVSQPPWMALATVVNVSSRTDQILKYCIVHAPVSFVHNVKKWMITLHW